MENQSEHPKIDAKLVFKAVFNERQTLLIMDNNSKFHTKMLATHMK